MASPFRCATEYTNGSTELLLQLSIQSLGIRTWANALLIIFGFIAFFTNIVVAIIIWRTKVLRTKCFCLIGANSLVDCLLGGAYGITAVKRIYRYLSGQGEVMNRWCCFCEVQMNGFFQLMSLAMAVVLVFDRFVAITRPIPYKQMGYRRLTVPLIAGAVLYSLIQYGVNFYDAYTGPRTPTLFACGIDDTLSDGMLTALMSVQLATSLLVLLMNFALAVVIRRQMMTQGSVVTSGDKELRACKIISVTAVVHVVVYLIGRVFILLAPLVFDDLFRSIVNRHVRDLTVYSAGLNCFFLLATSKDFRTSTKKFFGFSGLVADSVSPATALGTRT